MNYENKLKNSKTIADIFDIVKDVVKEFVGIEQAGLMVGVADLGSHGQGFVGAFYSLDSNIIIINKRPLKRILQTNPYLYNNYLFHIILHEYIHSIGLFDEARVRQLVYEISQHYFGLEHPVTQFASSIEQFIPNLTYPKGFQPSVDINIDFVNGIDIKNTNYIM